MSGNLLTVKTDRNSEFLGNNFCATSSHSNTVNEK